MKQIAIITILLLAFFAAVLFAAKQRQARLTAENNLRAGVIQHNQQMELTKKQLSEFYGAEITELTKKLGQKPKQVIHYIQGAIQYRDTGSTKIITRPGDTVKIYPDSISGKIETDCHQINILLYKQKFSATIDYKDTIQTLIYKERPHKFLCIKYGRWIHKAAIYSQCRDTTFQVIKNIRVN